jgi:hypothetical protein
MKQIMFNRNRVVIVAVFLLAALIVLSVYFHRINIFEDVTIEPLNATFKKSNPELVLVTPFNRKFPMQLNEDGVWETKHSYLNRIYVKVRRNAIRENELAFKINNQKLNLDSDVSNGKGNAEYKLIELAFTTDGNFRNKINYVFHANSKIVKDIGVGKWILLVVYGLGLLFFIFVFMLKRDNQLVIFERINAWLGIGKFDWVQKNTGFEIVLFFVLWLTLIILMI